MVVDVSILQVIDGLDFRFDLLDVRYGSSISFGGYNIIVLVRMTLPVLWL